MLLRSLHSGGIQKYHLRVSDSELCRVIQPDFSKNICGFESEEEQEDKGIALKLDPILLMKPKFKNNEEGLSQLWSLLDASHQRSAVSKHPPVAKKNGTFVKQLTFCLDVSLGDTTCTDDSFKKQRRCTDSHLVYLMYTPLYQKTQVRDLFSLLLFTKNIRHVL